MTANNKENMITDFQHIVENYPGQVDNDDFSDLGDIKGKSLQDVVDSAISEIDKIPVEHIFDAAPPSLSQLVGYLRTKVPVKACVGIASHWPVVIPLSMPHLHNWFNLFIHMTKRVSDPNNSFSNPWENI